ncbi:MAG: cytochrome c [Polyangiaceae bacterium]
MTEGQGTGFIHRSGLALAVATLALGACQNRQAFHEPEPGLERMLLQHRGKPYTASSAFSDGRVMRPPVPDTVAKERPWLGRPLLETGRDETGYAAHVPLPVTSQLLRLGQASFDRVCATCHGVLGDGHSVVAEKMELRRPPSLHEPRIEALAPGQVFEVTSLGYGLMPSFAPMLSVEERWATVAYLGALRLSQHAPSESLPPKLRAALAQEAP